MSHYCRRYYNIRDVFRILAAGRANLVEYHMATMGDYEVKGDCHFPWDLKLVIRPFDPKTLQEDFGDSRKAVRVGEHAVGAPGEGWICFYEPHRFLDVGYYLQGLTTRPRLWVCDKHRILGDPTNYLLALIAWKKNYTLLHGAMVGHTFITGWREEGKTTLGLRLAQDTGQRFVSDDLVLLGDRDVIGYVKRLDNFALIQKALPRNRRLVAKVRRKLSAIPMLGFLFYKDYFVPVTDLYPGIEVEPSLLPYRQPFVDEVILLRRGVEAKLVEVTGEEKEEVAKSIWITTIHSLFGKNKRSLANLIEPYLYLNPKEARWCERKEKLAFNRFKRAMRVAEIYVAYGRGYNYPYDDILKLVRR